MTANILVIDDVEPNIKLLEAKLLNEYYTVFTAQSATKGLQIIENNNIDLVLLDVMMPKMDGIEMCKILKSNKNTMHIPVIMITALSDIQDRVKGLQAGADEFLTKPINDIPLFARVKSLTRTKSLIDELMLRNQTNQNLGIGTIKIHENFEQSKILLLNDDLIQTKSIKQIISTLSQNIKIITKIKELNDLDKDYIPDLIIISSHLEHTDSLRIVAFLKNTDKYKNTAIMMVSEEENNSKVIKSMELGVSDYFVYPVDKNELIARVKTQLRRKIYQDDLRKFMDQTINLAISDGLTNIFNRRYFDIYLKEMIQKTNKEHTNLWMIIFDIDNFKKINDNYGHQEGDQLLKLFADILKSSIRITDLAARYGGEEFVILLKDITFNTAIDIAERIRINLQNHEITTTHHCIINSTVSGGITSYKLGETANSFISRADHALYQAKHSGCNKIVLI